jgi:sec-independent protein translocase protein TatA
MPNLGIWEILLLLLVLLLVFGPKRLPQMGRSLGHGMREFKDSVTGKSQPDLDDDEDEVQKVELTPATATTAQPTAQPATAPAQPAQPESER